MTAERGWKRPFDDPIPLPRDRQLVTLEDAGRYITKLPKAEHEAKEWQAAMEALILVATHGGPTMLADGLMRALNRNAEPVFNPSRKDKRWGRRKLARDRMRRVGSDVRPFSAFRNQVSRTDKARFGCDPHGPGNYLESDMPTPTPRYQ